MRTVVVTRQPKTSWADTRYIVQYRPNGQVHSPSPEGLSRDVLRETLLTINPNPKIVENWLRIVDDEPALVLDLNHLDT